MNGCNSIWVFAYLERESSVLFCTGMFLFGADLSLRNQVFQSLKTTAVGSVLDKREEAASRGASCGLGRVYGQFHIVLGRSSFLYSCRFLEADPLTLPDF